MKQRGLQFISTKSWKFYLLLIICLLFSTTGNVFAQSSYDPAYYLIYHDLYGNNLSDRGVELLEQIDVGNWWAIRTITSIPSGKKVGAILIGGDHAAVVLPYEIDDLLDALNTMLSLTKEKAPKTGLMKEEYLYRTKYTKTQFRFIAERGNWNEYGPEGIINLRLDPRSYINLEKAKKALEDCGISNWESDIDLNITDVFELCLSLSNSLNRIE